MTPLLYLISVIGTCFVIAVAITAAIWFWVKRRYGP